MAVQASSPASFTLTTLDNGLRVILRDAGFQSVPANSGEENPWVETISGPSIIWSFSSA